MDRRVSVPLLLALCAFILAGCSTPGSGQLTRSRVLAPDQEDDIGGSFIESADIRTVASKMCPAILSLPEISQAGGTVRVAVSPMRNSTRHVFDKDIFVKRLRIELNRYGDGKIRFIDPAAAGATTERIARERDDSAWERTVDAAAQYLVDSPVVRDSPSPLRVAVLPVRNVNLIDMNGDSFTALLRAKIAEKASGKISFLMQSAAPADDPAAAYPDADYFLSGEFIAGSVKQEELDRTTLYAVTRDSISMSTQTSTAPPADGSAGASSQASASAVKSTNLTPLAEYKDSPNVTKYLNIMLIDAKTRQAALEKLVKVESQTTSGLENAQFVLTGEVSALSKGAGGNVSDYVIMSFQLIDPDGNEVVWEDAYETKRVTNRSVIYK